MFMTKGRCCCICLLYPSILTLVILTSVSTNLLPLLEIKKCNQKHSCLELHL